MNDSPVTLQTYALELIGPPDGLHHPPFASLIEHRRFTLTNGLPPGIVKEIEENATDLLPDGYSVQIKEWDSE